MQHPKTVDFEALLRALQDGGVQFIVVGGAAGGIHGAPITTQDLDIVPEQTPANLVRLSNVLEAIGARYRPWQPDRDLVPTAAHLAGSGQLKLTTQMGPLDVLCRLSVGSMMRADTRICWNRRARSRTKASSFGS